MSPLNVLRRMHDGRIRLHFAGQLNETRTAPQDRAVVMRLRWQFAAVSSDRPGRESLGAMPCGPSPAPTPQLGWQDALFFVPKSRWLVLHDDANPEDSS